MEYVSRDRLARNLRALLDSHASVRTPRDAERISERRLSKTNVDRLTRAEGACNLDTLDELAEVFGVSPIALIEPAGATHHVPLSDDAREIGEDFDRLSPERRSAARAQIDLILSGSAPTVESLRRAAERMQQAADRMEWAASAGPAAAPVDTPRRAPRRHL